jgi:hypothetical protein
MAHLFFRCDFFRSLWHLIYQWIGINFTSPESVNEHLHQFGHLAGLPRFTHSFLQVIWHAGCWVVWKEINNKKISHTAKDLVNLLENVKFMSFAWFKAKMLIFAFSYTDWWRHPLLCMSVME